MNHAVIMGRLTKNPDTRTTNNDLIVSRYTLAVDRRGRKDEADFIPCVAFGKAGEFAEKYLSKGMKIVVSGHIQTGSYTNKEGQKVYTTDLIIESQEFAESKKKETNDDSGDDFMSIPDGIEEELPFA